MEAVGGVKVVGGVAGGESLVARRGWDAARVDAVHPHSYATLRKPPARRGRRLSARVLPGTVAAKPGVRLLPGSTQAKPLLPETSSAMRWPKWQLCSGKASVAGVALAGGTRRAQRDTNAA